MGCENHLFVRKGCGLTTQKIESFLKVRIIKQWQINGLSWLAECVVGLVVLLKLRQIHQLHP